MSALARELIGTLCRCGRTKRKGQTFCSHCYFALPPFMRKALYRRMGEGYEEAYAAACERFGFSVSQDSAQPAPARSGASTGRGSKQKA